MRIGDEVVVQAPNLGWRDEPFHELLRHPVPALDTHSTGQRCRCRRDGGTLREAAWGASDAIHLIGKIGVGAGMIVDGKALTGAGRTGRRGRSHGPADPAGPVCRCGSNGCMEALVGEAALLRASGWLRPPHQARRRAGRWRHAASWVSRPLGRASPRLAPPSVSRIANLVNLLNPEVAVLRWIARADSGARGDEHARPSQIAHAMAGPRGMVTLRTPGLGERFVAGRCRRARVPATAGAADPVPGRSSSAGLSQ